MAEAFGTRTLRELSRVVFARVGLVLTVSAIITLTTLVGCLFLWTPVYRSTVSLIYKQPAPRNPVTRDSPERTLEVFVKAQQQIVISSLVLARTYVIADNAGWRSQWEEIRKLPAEAGHAAAAAFMERIGPEVQLLLTTQGEVIRELRRSIGFETPGGEQVAMSESFTIRVDRPGPRNRADSHLDAQRTASLLADMYLYRYRELQDAMNTPARAFIEGRVKEFYETEVAPTENALRRFVESLPQAGDVAVLEQLLKSGTEHGEQITATTARNELVRLERLLAEARALRAGVLGQVPEAARGAGGPEGMDAAALRGLNIAVPQRLLETNVIVHELARKVGDLRSRERRLAVRYTEANRELRDLRREIDGANRQMLRELLTAAEAAAVEIDTLEAQRKQVAESLEQTTSRLNRISRLLPEYQRLKNDVAIAQKQYEVLKREMADARTNEAQARLAVTVGRLDEASTPDRGRPQRPNTPLYTGLAFAVSLVIGLAAAFVGDHFDHTLRTIGEAERYLGVPVLGTVSRRGEGLITSSEM